MGLFDFIRRKKNSLNKNVNAENTNQLNKCIENETIFDFKTIEREDHTPKELDWLDKTGPIYIDNGDTQLHTDVLYTDDGLSVFINVETDNKAKSIIETILKLNGKTLNFKKEIVDEYDSFYVCDKFSIGYRDTNIGLYQVDIISKKELEKSKIEISDSDDSTYDLNKDEDYLELLKFFNERPNINRIFKEFTESIRKGFSVRQYLDKANLMVSEDVKNVTIWAFSNIIGFCEAILEKNENYDMRKDLDALIEAIKILNEENKEKLFRDWGITDNEQYWINVINMRVNSMPFTLNSDNNEMTYYQSLDELGIEHCEEYKFGDNRVPKNKRIEVAIERIEGFISIRDYIQKVGTIEQKFHLDASIVGALLYAHSLGKPINDELLKYKTLSTKLKSNNLDNLYNQIDRDKKKLEKVKSEKSAGIERSKLNDIFPKLKGIDLNIVDEKVFSPHTLEDDMKGKWYFGCSTIFLIYQIYDSNDYEVDLKVLLKNNSIKFTNQNLNNSNINKWDGDGFQIELLKANNLPYKIIFITNEKVLDDSLIHLASLKDVEGIKLNWIYGIDEVYDHSTFDNALYMFNVPIYWEDEQNKLDNIYIRTINKQIAFSLIDEIIKKNGSKSSFKIINDNKSIEYLHKGDIFYIGYLAENECVKIIKSNFKVLNIKNDDFYGISNYDNKLRKLIKGLNKISYNIGEGPNNKKLCFGNKKSTCYFDTVEESLELFKNIVINYDTSHDVFIRKDIEINKLIEEVGLLFIDYDFRLSLISEEGTYIFEIFPSDAFFEN